MTLDLPDQVKLTYCLNVHPGEGWPDQMAALREHVPLLRQRLERDGSFGVGLRISGQGVQDLHAAESRIEAIRLFREMNLDPFTFNGFPYGTFHGARVKEQVYQPDWRSRERVKYTKDLADIMVSFLGAGKGSISTVPAAFGTPAITPSEEIVMAEHLAECVGSLHRQAEESGCEIILGLEPEPACHIETTSQFIRFYEEVVLVHGPAILDKMGYPSVRGEEILRRHLGICLDTCHAAIQFETVDDSIARILAAGIPIAKIQISNALELCNSPEARKALADFVEPVYLHQVRVEMPDGTVRPWTDLPEGLAALASLPDDLRVRVHFHVPLFWEGCGLLKSTRETLTPAFWKLCREGVTSHLEMETYTFSVLPGAAGKYDLTEMLEREYRWVLARLLPPT